MLCEAADSSLHRPDDGVVVDVFLGAAQARRGGVVLPVGDDATLFGSAEAEVLVAGFAVYQDRAVFKRLATT